MYTPFDINEAVAQRRDYVEEGLRSGSPVAGIRYEHGLLLLTVRRTQRKVYEIYDRQMFSAIGRQSDIENLRLSAIQTAHQEGFERSPDDVTLHRLVGFTLSPTIKRAFGDPMYMPIVIRAIFAELGRTSDHDCFYTLNYDGEFRSLKSAAVIAGSSEAEELMLDSIGVIEQGLSSKEAAHIALKAWIIGMREALKVRTREIDIDKDLPNPLRKLDDLEEEKALLQEELKTGSVEIGLLERRSNKEPCFRLFSEEEAASIAHDFL